MGRGIGNAREGMGILLLIDRERELRFFVKVAGKAAIDRIKDLVGKKKNREAMMLALVNGRFEKEVDSNEMTGVKANLILSETNASWDLVE